jgi:hypothetical protein
MNTNYSRSKPISFYILAFLIFFQAVSGLFGGGALVIDPSGSLLNMPLSLLSSSPFHNYLIPGVILLSVLGVGPGIVFCCLMRGIPRAWEGSVLVSIALIVWIAVQVAMVGYHPQPPLQLIYGILGITLLILTQLPSVKIALK